MLSLPLQVAQGPTNDSLKVLRLVTSTWNMWYCLLQTQPVFAPSLPAPRQVFNQLQSRTGVVVHAIQDCEAFQASVCCCRCITIDSTSAVQQVVSLLVPLAEHAVPTYV
jgi:hypothetical protein